MKDLIANHPALGPFLRGAGTPQALGGLTNRNLRVESPQGLFVLRAPGAGTEQYINRKHEKTAALLTSRIEVNAPILYFDERTGVQLSRFLAGTVTMNSERFKDLSAVARAAQTFKKVHTSGFLFDNQFELFAMLDNYLKILEAKNAKLPEGFDAALRDAQVARQALNANQVSPVPCHCDPLAENFLDDGTRMYLVDWEYSGNNDPMWDLADLSIEADFDPVQEEALLKAYFAPHPPSAFDRGRVVLYKALCDLLWTLWGVIQHENKNTADDFWAYSIKRFDRCYKLMNSSEFQSSLRAVASLRA